jgi:putative two-component system response regulator
MRALIVDDDELSLELLDDVLNELGYEVERAVNGKDALAKLRETHIHLVITDWEMPEMNGLELCKAIREGDFEGYVFIILLTGREGGQRKIEGLHGGADAFLAKPLNPDELLVSLKTAERILSLETRDLAMFALAKLSESRDPETGSHIERVQSYARLLAQHLSTTDRYHGLVDTDFIRLIFQTSPLHDIGKVGIPDNVLLKPGKLDDDEMAIMRTHASLGAQTLEASLQRFPRVRFLQMARDIAACHHERWDGKGYPLGLAGEDIPLAARIVALADVYDALTSRRVYREAISHSQAKAMIVQERGTQFDSAVVDAFLSTEQQFIQIRERFNDSEQLQARGVKKDCVRVSPTQPMSKMLVVDDDPIGREMLTGFLVSQGFDVATCGDATEGLELLRTHGARLIISDWKMPGIDGLEFCRRARSTVGLGHIHFVLLTMHTGKEELAEAFDAGIDDFLAKPFNEGELMARIRSGIRSLTMQDELARRHQGSKHLNEQLTNLNQRLEKLAITDDLTGLYNRRQALHRLEEHWSLSERYQKPLAVISLDIDHFKLINDAHGHAAGDLVLRGVADTLLECVRNSDSVCRIGGEEFLIILPYQTAGEAEIVAQRCRERLEGREFDCDGKLIRVTLSAGLASRRADIKHCADMLQEADEALYAAKRAGRNTIRWARGDGAVPALAS